jgi:hypothetical protein
MGEDKTAFRLSRHRNAGIEPHRFPSTDLEAGGLDERRIRRRFAAVSSS